MKILKAKVDEYLNSYIKQNKFTGSVLVSRHGETLVSKGYGMANVEHEVANTPLTKFRLGSITKQFTAMAIMQLQEKEFLKVEDTLSKYLPDYFTGSLITIHHLLTHTSGIPNYTSFPEVLELKKLVFTPEKLINLFKDKPLDFKPGEKYSYSNSGYITLGYLIEKTSRKSYENYLQEHIFQPLGMINTGYDWNQKILKNRAAGYSWGEEGLINAEYVDMSFVYAAGGLYSTVEDLAIWDRALYTEKLVSKTSLEKTWTAFQKNYGYGWLVTEIFNRKMVGHNGLIDGFSTEILRFTNDEVLIVVLSNSEITPVSQITKDLSAIVFEEPYELPKEKKPVEIDAKIYQAYAGEYEIKPGFILTITTTENQIFAQATGQFKFEIFPESEIKYFANMPELEITFIKTDIGEVKQLMIHQLSQEFPANKIETSSNPPIVNN